MDPTAVVEREVRELVRRRGLDPGTERAAVRRLVDEVIADYDERALTSSLQPLPDNRRTAQSVFDAIAGFGPLQRYLDDPLVEEVWINGRLRDGWGRLAPFGDAKESPGLHSLRWTGAVSAILLRR
ncbi:MAG: hypothetical protein ABIM89_01745 [Mycobacteriales bacterium]